MWAARAIALFVVTFLAFDAMLQGVVEMRGGSDYIKPYHSWNMVFCSAVSVCIFEVGRHTIATIRRFPWPMQWLAFVHLVIVVTFIGLPLADLMGVRNERSLGEPFESDMGYGWYYWDDSGMGGDPVTGPYLFFFLGQPLRLASFLFGSGAIFAMAHRPKLKKQGEDAPDRPL